MEHDLCSRVFLDVRDSAAIFVAIACEPPISPHRPGTTSLRAEFVAVDHGPFEPRVESRDILGPRMSPQPAAGAAARSLAGRMRDGGIGLELTGDSCRQSDFGGLAA